MYACLNYLIDSSYVCMLSFINCHPFFISLHTHTVQNVRYQVNVTATLCQNTVLVGSQQVFTREGGMQSNNNIILRHLH